VAAFVGYTIGVPKPTAEPRITRRQAPCDSKAYGCGARPLSTPCGLQERLRHFAGASVQIGGSEVLSFDDVDDLICVWTDNDIPAIDKNNLIAAPLRIDFNDAGRDRIELDRGRNARPD
jgi:hypothetical protein